MKHKLKQVMLERDAAKLLTGKFEIDAACLSGERSGGKPVRLKLSRVVSLYSASIAGSAKRSLDPACRP